MMMLGNAPIATAFEVAFTRSQPRQHSRVSITDVAIPTSPILLTSDLVTVSLSATARPPAMSAFGAGRLS